jgi:predicted amidophosphoribosyltransferase
MTGDHPRIKREKRTLDVMIRMYCKAHHGSSKELCDECNQVLTYALSRLNRCQFQENKPTCAKCTVHCYKPDMRERVRVVMRYSGPRMLLRHPILAVQHLRDGRRKAPTENEQKGTSDQS